MLYFSFLSAQLKYSLPCKRMFLCGKVITEGEFIKHDNKHKTVPYSLNNIENPECKQHKTGPYSLNNVENPECKQHKTGPYSLNNVA